VRVVNGATSWNGLKFSGTLLVNGMWTIGCGKVKMQNKKTCFHGV
jgi:hypothetical protein